MARNGSSKLIYFNELNVRFKMHVNKIRQVFRRFKKTKNQFNEVDLEETFYKDFGFPRR